MSLPHIPLPICPKPKPTKPSRFGIFIGRALSAPFRHFSHPSVSSSKADFSLFGAAASLGVIFLGFGLCGVALTAARDSILRGFLALCILAVIPPAVCVIVVIDHILRVVFHRLRDSVFGKTHPPNNFEAPPAIESPPTDTSRHAPRRRKMHISPQAHPPSHSGDP